MSDWDSLQTWFEKLVVLPDNARQGALRALREDDPALAAELEGLLAADSQQETRIGWRVRRAASGLPLPGELGPGDEIGNWRVISHLGRGGMGIVYQVERISDDFDQVAALKLVATTGDSTLGDYFLRERQIMARLGHPNIAGLLDGGVLDDGRPWLVMEFIEGTPIHEWCDAHRLDVRQRLALFMRALDAVQFAHRNLVLHKDLKFSNLLVTEDGQPKLLDFGTASMMRADQASESTQTRLLALTPEFSSPERIRNEPLTTASDLYSLGVMLYALLCGELPLEVDQASPAEIEKIVAEQAPRPPSAAAARATENQARARGASPARLQRQLAGDLDAIVLKCLSKEPERRYATVEALKEDLCAFLDGSPVAARRDTFAYRLKKFMGRHRWPLATSLALLLAGCIGLYASLTSYLELEKQRAQLELLADFQTELLLTLRPDEIGTAAMDWLERESRDLDTMNSNAFDQLRAGVNETDLGRTLIDVALLARAIERIGEHFADMPMLGSEMARSVAANYNQLMLQDRTMAALEVAEQMAAADPDGMTEALRLRALRLGILQRTGQMEEAEAELRAMQQQLAEQPDLADAMVRGIVYKSLGDITARQGDRALALQWYERSLQYRRDGGHENAVRIVLQDIAGIRSAMGDPKAAREIYQELDQAWSADHSNEHPRAVSARLAEASALSDLGRLDQAEQMQRDILALRRRVHGEEDQRTLVVLNNLGITLHRQGDTRRGMEKLRRVFEKRYAVYGPSDPWTINSAVRVSAFYLESGDAGMARQVAASILSADGVEDSNRKKMLELIEQVARTEQEGPSAIGLSIPAASTLQDLTLTWYDALLVEQLLARLEHKQGLHERARRRLEQARDRLPEWLTADHHTKRQLRREMARLEPQAVEVNHQSGSAD